jgi:hypothetical protein
MKRWLLLFSALFVLLPGRVWAQAADVVSHVDTNEVELGDVVTYTLEASSPTAPPSDPRMTVPNGFSLVNSGASPSHMVSIINGRTSEKHALTATWTLRADRLGTFTIGPGSVQAGAARKNGTTEKVVVVAPGQGRAKPKRATRPSFDPFGPDPFKGLFPSIDDEPSDSFLGISVDPKLSLDVPRAPVAFLHATVDKTRAVVGEQVTLTVYLYEDLHARQGRPSDVHEATATDFVKRSLLQDETRATHVGNTTIGGKPWSVKLVRKNALFPLKTGRLAIAPMSLTLPQARVGLRESQTLYVDVSEPPIAGRPPGYQVGDTGDFSLSATASPRETDQHGAIGVTIELRGTGNLPAALATPEIQGVEWLEPQTKDSLGPVSAERFGGTRTFSYVVRIHKDGALDLGEMRLPFYDPAGRTYQIARAALGIVQVRKGDPKNAQADAPVAPLPDLPVPRAALERSRGGTFVTERPLYWALLFGSPLACALGIVVASTARKIRERRASIAPSPERVAKGRWAEAEKALRGSDGAAAVAAVLRAIEADVLARYGVNLRGTSGEAALRELEDAGASDPRAIRDVIAACEDARFSPTGVSMTDAKALEARARKALAKAQ